MSVLDFVNKLRKLTGYLFSLPSNMNVAVIPANSAMRRSVEFNIVYEYDRRAFSVVLLCYDFDSPVSSHLISKRTKTNY